MIENYGLDQDEAVFFCFAVEHKRVHFVIDKGLVTPENEHLFRINLTQLDESGELSLRVPLYGGMSDNLFDQFIQGLTNTGLELTGYPYNAQEYVILTTDTDTVNNFVRLKMLIGEDFDMEKLIAAVAKYYQTTAKAKTLKNFLVNDAIQAYKMQR